MELAGRLEDFLANATAITTSLATNATCPPNPPQKRPEWKDMHCDAQEMMASTFFPCFLIVFIVLATICYWFFPAITDPVHKWNFLHIFGHRTDKESGQPKLKKDPDWAFLNAIAPEICFLLFVFGGSFDNQHPPCGVSLTDYWKPCANAIGVFDGYGNSVIGPINTLIAKAGPLVPYVIAVVQYFILPWTRLAEKKVIGHSINLPALPVYLQSWLWASLGLWVFMSILRLTLYTCLMKEWNYYVSDHLFMTACMIAQIQMIIFLVHNAVSPSFCQVQQDPEKWTLPLKILMGVCWTLVLLTCVGAFVTAKYYHTRQAAVTGTLIGIFIFDGIAFWWIGRIRAQEGIIDREQIYEGNSFPSNNVTADTAQPLLS